MDSQKTVELQLPTFHWIDFQETHSLLIVIVHNIRLQAGAKLDQAQLKLGLDFCPALTKLALDLHVNLCLFVCLSFRSFFQGV